MTTPARLGIPSLFLVLGCGGGPSGLADAPAPEDHAGGTEDPGDIAPIPDRTFPLAATFGEVVARVQAIAEAGGADSDAGCVLAPAPPEGGVHRLNADLAPAIRPLPEAPPRVVPTLEEPAAPTTLTVWGRFGSEGAGGPVLATFTTASPPGPGDVLVAIPEDGPPLVRPLGALPAGEDAVPGDEPVSAVMTADAATPITRVATVLRAHPEWDQIVWAVLLPADTRLPASPADGDVEGGALCPEGLPPGGGDAAVGELGVDAVRAGIAPLVEATRVCTSAGTGSVAGGGLLEIELRIAQDGAVAQTCAAVDTTHDPGFRACVLDAAGRLRFPAPSPTGSVDVAIPLRVPVAAGIRQSPLCD